MSRRQTFGRWLSTSDAALSWAERIAKLVVLGIGSGVLSSAVGIVIGFITGNPLSGLVIGVVVGMVILSGFAVQVVRIATAGQTQDNRLSSSPQTDPEDDPQLRTKLSEVEQERDSANAVIQEQQEQLSEWDGDRQRFRHFLIEAWSEGTNLRGSKPSKEEAREWEGHVRHLLEQARGEEFADKALRHDPNFQSADFDASGAQKFSSCPFARDGVAG